MIANQGDGKQIQNSHNQGATQPLKESGAQNPSFKRLKLPSKSWKKDNSDQAVKVTVKKEQKPKREASSNSNKENLNIEKHLDTKKDNFNFPDGGWVCCFCQNYNFYGRLKCNRCRKGKSREDCDGKPQHIIRKEMKTSKKNDENNMNNMNKMSKLKMKKQAQAVKIQPVEVPVSENIINDGSKTQNSERLGDWI